MCRSKEKAIENFIHQTPSHQKLHTSTIDESIASLSLSSLVTVALQLGKIIMNYEENIQETFMAFFNLKIDGDLFAFKIKICSLKQSRRVRLKDDNSLQKLS